MQSQSISGRKRGRPPLHSAPMKVAVQNLYSTPVGSLPAAKIPKKRGRKPGYKLKTQALITPRALSPPRSTPEPDLSSIPQDAATIPSLTVPQTLTVCLYINKQANAGPYLAQRKVQQLPEHFGPERPSAVLQQAVQACIDCAHQQKLVFSLVKQGYGGEMMSVPALILELLEGEPEATDVKDKFGGPTYCGFLPARLYVNEGSLNKVSASFDGKQHLRSLPVVNSLGYVLRFLTKLCRSLLCDDLFSHQPFPRGCRASQQAQMEEEGRMKSAKIVSTEDCLASLISMSRYSMDSSISAINHRGALPTTSSVYCKRQNSADGPLGGHSALTAGGPHCSTTVPRGTTAPGLRPPGSSPKRKGTSLDGIRCASSPSSDRPDSRQLRGRNPSTWTVEDVVWFVMDADPQSLGPHVELFRKHEIDGHALLLLKSDMIMKYLGLKLGPALKLCYHIDKLKQAKF